MAASLAQLVSKPEYDLRVEHASGVIYRLRNHGAAVTGLTIISGSGDPSFVRFDEPVHDSLETGQAQDFLVLDDFGVSSIIVTCNELVGPLRLAV